MSLQHFLNGTNNDVLAAIQKLNKHHLHIHSLGRKGRVVFTSIDPVSKRRKFSPQYYSDFRNGYRCYKVKYNGKYIRLGDLWLQHPLHRQYDDFVFEPGQQLPPNIFNLWQGLGVNPEPIPWPLGQYHLYEVLANGDKAVGDDILRWMAWVVQNPGEQSGVALVLRGRETIRKSCWANAARNIFGQHGHRSSVVEINRPFNRYFLDVCLLFVREPDWKDEVLTVKTLQRLIIERTITVHLYGVGKVFMPNHIHLIIGARKNWVVPAGIDKGHFAIFDVSDQHQCDKAYFDALDKEFSSGGLQGMLHDLLAMNLHGWHPRMIGGL